MFSCVGVDDLHSLASCVRAIDLRPFRWFTARFLSELPMGLVRSIALSLVLISMTACSAPAENTAATEAAVTAEAAAAQLELEDLIRVTRVLHEKFTSLAEAIPEDDLAWRPVSGVRSVSEVYVHIAADNWYVPALMGWDAPDETGVTANVETFRTYQDQEMSRADMLQVLDGSFDFLLGAMEESSGELDREVVLGTPTTVGDVWIRAVVHLHEHLGQSIAYARTNEVVPPWSR